MRSCMASRKPVTTKEQRILRWIDMAIKMEGNGVKGAGKRKIGTVYLRANVPKLFRKTSRGHAIGDGNRIDGCLSSVKSRHVDFVRV